MGLENPSGSLRVSRIQSLSEWEKNFGSNGTWTTGYIYTTIFWVDRFGYVVGTRVTSPTTSPRQERVKRVINTIQNEEKGLPLGRPTGSGPFVLQVKKDILRRR